MSPRAVPRVVLMAVWLLILVTVPLLWLLEGTFQMSLKQHSSSGGGEEEEQQEWEHKHSPLTSPFRPNATIVPWDWLMLSQREMDETILNDESVYNPSICGPCCVGVVNTIAGDQGLCDERWTSNVTFVLRNSHFTPLHSLVEALRLVHRVRPNDDHIPRIVFLGDSVSGQLFNSATCELARSEGVNIMEHITTPIMGTAGMGQWHWRRVFESTVETKVKITNADGTTFLASIMYVRQMKPFDLGAMVSLCTDFASLLVLGFGLHYNHQDMMQEYRTEMYKMAAGLRDASKRCILFNHGANAQHFQAHRFGTWTNPGMTDAIFCNGISPISQDNFFWDWRGRELRLAFERAGFHVTDVQDLWQHQRCEIQQQQQQLNWISPPHIFSYPAWALSVPFHFNHPQFERRDCVHTCQLPTLSIPLWDAIYRAIAHQHRKSVCDNTGKKHVPWPGVRISPQEYRVNVDVIVNKRKQVPFSNESPLWPFRNGSGMYIGKIELNDEDG